MAKSKNRKNHKEKLAKRNAKIQQDKDKFHKFQKEMLMKYIEEEKKKGMFDNKPTIGPITDGPVI